MLSSVKRDARLAMFEAMGEPATYTDPTLAGPVPTLAQQALGLALTPRWHNKTKMMGEMNSDSVAIFEGVERVIFSDEQLITLGLTLRRGGTLTFPGYGVAFTLDQREQSDGPVNVYWSVTRD